MKLRTNFGLAALVASFSGLAGVSEAVITPSSCACNTPNCNTYGVGPGQPYPDIASVPLTTLQPGDWICIHPSSTPYKEKFVINLSGTAAAPIVVSGVIDETTGERPIIDGDGATTPLALNYWNEVRNLVKIGGASVPNESVPSHIIVQNLHLVCESTESTHGSWSMGGQIPILFWDSNF